MKVHSALSVFDLDHTLIDKNSSLQFGRFLFRRGHISPYLLCQLLFYYFRHKVFGLDIEVLHRKAVQSFIGSCDKKELDIWARDFFKERGEELLCPPIVELLRKAQSSGHYTLLLSSSPSFIVQPFAEYFAVDEWKGSQYSIHSNCAKASVFHTINGKDKLQITQAVAEKLSISMDKVTAYTDSILDLPLLEAVGTAVGVNPDRELKDVCIKRQWETIIPSVVEKAL